MKDQEELRQEVAVFRYQLISGVVNRATPLKPGEIASYFKEVSATEWTFPGGKPRKVSVRSLERYKQRYEQGGLEALKPALVPKRGTTAIPKEVLMAAEALRKERPQRGVEQIIFILEGNGLIEKGTVAASTLRRHFRRQGLPRQKHSSMANQHYGFRRFEAERPLQMWQADFQHTLYLPQADGRKRKAKLCAILDDYARYVVHAQFYYDEKMPCLEDSLKKAIEKHGLCEQFYCDNGAAFSSKHIANVCARLGIRLSHSRPYRPQGRGKIEKFFQFVDSSFKPEAYAAIEAGRIHSLEELNQAFQGWLHGYYHTRIHGATGESPAKRLGQYPVKPLPYEKEQLRRFFFLEETRKVDKAGCISLSGAVYEVPQELSGLSVQIRFDPFDLSDAEVYESGRLYGTARLLDARANFKKKRNPEISEVASSKEPELKFSMLDAAWANLGTEPMQYRKKVKDDD